jgi:methyltransferase (TIGR00027 family)
MAKPSVYRTALGAAACRLMEQHEPEETRLFSDPLIQSMFSKAYVFFFQFAGMRRATVKLMARMAEGIYGSQVCRTVYINEVVQAALDQKIDQVVILGAGLDTRGFSLPGITRAHVFELDLPLGQKEKKSRIQRHFGRIPENVTFIPIDFDSQSLHEALAGSGYDPTRPAVFVWEAVTQYITESAVWNTLAFVGRSTPGSVLVFTYILLDIIERRFPGSEKLMKAVAQDSPWIFGLDPAALPEFLKPYNLTLVKDVGNEYYQEKYLRPRGRKLVVSEVERVAHAVVTR